jgi:hypothetical protein
MRGVPKNESEAELKKVLQEMRMNRTALQNWNRQFWGNPSTWVN